VLTYGLPYQRPSSDRLPHIALRLAVCGPQTAPYNDRNYFRLRAISEPVVALTGEGSDVGSSRPGSTRTTSESERHEGTRSPLPTSDRLDEAFFNQGYYAKFFHEERKLGHGLRGSVYLVRHVMHEVELGRYAVKKVPVGTDHGQSQLPAQSKR